MNASKAQHENQKQLGANITLLLLINIQSGKLNTIHVSLMQQEMEAQTQQIPDPVRDIRAFTVMLRANEEKRTGNKSKYFNPTVKPAEEWDVDWALDF